MVETGEVFVICLCLTSLAVVAVWFMLYNEPAPARKPNKTPTDKRSRKL